MTMRILSAARQQAAGGGRRPGRFLPAQRPRRHAGFSFTEVLFAVIILGIGFIMVAAIFPVAIQQAKITSEETAAASIARGAASYLEQAFRDGTSLPGSSNCQPKQTATTPAVACVQQPSKVVPTGGLSLVDTIRANLILPEDPRYGFVFLYRRKGGASADTWDPYAQLIVFPVQSRITPTFEQADLNPVSGNLWARPLPGNPPLRANIADSSETGNTYLVDLIEFLPNGANDQEAAVEGGYVVIANETTAAGRTIGQILKLGARRLDVDPNGRTWELQPGSDFTVDPGPDGIRGNSNDIKTITNAEVFIVGRSFNVSNSQYEGSALPISAYSTFVKVNQ